MKKICQKKNVVVKGMIILAITFLLITPVQAFSTRQNQTNKIQSSTTEAAKAWTTLYYLDVDSRSLMNIILNIDILEAKFIDEIASADNLNVLVLQDRLRDPAFLYYIDEDHNKILLEELGEVNMGDPQTLIDFISYGKEHYPAERYQLCLYGHANAWYGACPDDTSGGDIMTMDEFQQALTATDGVDLLCFIGCCQMGSLESVYELKDLCEIYVASESPGNENDWIGMLDDMCGLLNNNTNMSTVEYGEQIVQLICDNPNEFADTLTISAMRTDKIRGLVGAIEELCLHLYENDELYGNFKSARNLTKVYDFIQKSYLLDIYDFVDNYLEIETNQLIREVLSNIKTNLSETVIAECHGENQNGSHGLSIFYSSKYLISLYADYGLDFTQDTHWDELLYNHKEKSKNLLINNLFNQFLENHSHLFPLLRQLLGLQ